MSSLLSFMLLTWLHPLHLALCEIDYNAQSQSLEITHKIFIDDLQDALKAHFGREFYLASPKEKPEDEKYIEKYIQEHFSVKINGKTQKLAYWGKEYDHEAAWIYMEIYKVEPIQSFEVRNTLLLHLFDDQNNILNLNYAQKTRTLRFRKANESEKISF